MKRFIIFRTDRLGDFLIISNIIKKIKDKFKDSHITVVASPYNARIIKNYKIIDKTIIYKRNKSIINKFKIFKELNKYNYFASLSLDGKSFSNLVNFFINSKFKLGLSYKFNLNFFLFKIFWSKPNFIYNNLVFNYFNYFTSKKSLVKIEHLPTILSNLANKLKINVKKNDAYFFEINRKDAQKAKKIFRSKINKEFILIHFDEKWIDIKNIEEDLYKEIIKFQNRIKKKILISSNNNRFPYYLNFKNKIKGNKNIILLENLNLNIFERLIHMSKFSISCHSGFLVQISGFNKTNIIDIINKRDLTWYSCWKPLNTKHKFVYKSNFNKRFRLKSIFKQIITASKSFK